MLILRDEVLYSILYDGGNVGDNNQDFPWDKSEHQEEDKIEKDPLSESIIPDAAYTQQHAFWKGEGNRKAIRESQSKYFSYCTFFIPTLYKNKLYIRWYINTTNASFR